jgi:hypothetical protein
MDGGPFDFCSAAFSETFKADAAAWRLFDWNLPRSGELMR